MAASGYVLSAADVVMLKRLVADLRSRQGGVPSRSDDPLQDDYLAPETYVARTPAGGIPGAMVTGATGTAMTNPVPGCAMCDIWQLITLLPFDEDGTGTAVCDTELEEITGFQVLVHNLGGTAVGGDSFVLITRDKGGNWFVLGAGGGGLTATAAALFLVLGLSPSAPDLYDVRDVTPLPNDILIQPTGLPCWLFAPMGLELAPGLYYFGLFNGFYEALRFDGFPVPEVRPLFLGWGGWAKLVNCTNATIQYETY